MCQGNLKTRYHLPLTLDMTNEMHGKATHIAGVRIFMVKNGVVPLRTSPSGTGSPTAPFNIKKGGLCANGKIPVLERRK